MAVTLNAKGTSYPSFSIGKGGATLYQGTSAPDNADGIAGDIYFYINGSSSVVYIKQGSVWTGVGSGSGSGNVTGPVSSTNNAIPTYNGTTGELIQNTNVTIDSNNTVIINKNSNNVKSSAYTLYNTTTGTTATQLFLDGSSQQLVLSNNTTINFKIQIAARVAGTAGTSFVATYNGAIYRDGSAATTALIGNIAQEQLINPGNLDWSVLISADSTNGALKIQAIGDTATNILWAAVVNTIEVTG